MQLYANPNRPEDAANCAAFLRVVNEYPIVSLYQPAPDKAPWHVQAVIDLGRYPQVLNFWPHLLKGQRDGCKSVQGEAALRGIIEGAIADASGEPFDMIEG